MPAFRIAIMCLTLASILAPAAAYADRPQKGDGPAVKAKLGEVLARTEELNTRLVALCDAACQQTPAGAKFHNKAQRVKMANDRVRAAHIRADPADFQEVSRKRPKKTDGVVLAVADDEFDEDRGRDMIEDLDEVAAEVDQLTAILGGNLPPPPPPDIALENAQYFFPTWMWPSSEVMFSGFVANLAAEKAAAIADHFCDQTAVAVGFGGNGSAACSVVEGVYQVLNAVYQMLDYIGQDVMSAEVTGTYKRTKNIFDQLAIADGNIDQLKVVIQAMAQQLLILEQNQKKIIELLSTPQGQRPAFPIK
jgi:hypothetical protein